MGKTIALLTDFGLRDGYVAAMKGIIYSIDAEIRIIDITHEIEPQNINEAAFILWNVYPYFPKKTVFVSVVDPGVGSKRNILCLEANNFYFLAPDNGLL
ncbi:MAG: SAM-dependent chlorinase/fluorinase [Bacteroidota bacterium]|nr:SAM-dependent chlorinase/fluorinase [Bacteroidota bacterium]